MYWQFMWFVLAGFVLGFVVSTLWEWFHFRRERMILRDQRIEELEAQVRAYARRQRAEDTFAEDAFADASFAEESERLDEEEWPQDEDVEDFVAYADPEPSAPPLFDEEPYTFEGPHIHTGSNSPATLARLEQTTPEGVALDLDDHDDAAGRTQTVDAGQAPETPPDDAPVTEEFPPAGEADAGRYPPRFAATATAVAVAAASVAADDADVTAEPEPPISEFPADFDPHADADTTEESPTQTAGSAFDARADADIIEVPGTAGAQHRAGFDADADADTTEESPTQTAGSAFDAGADADITEAPRTAITQDRAGFDANADITVGSQAVPLFAAAGTTFDPARDADVTAPFFTEADQADIAAADADVTEAPETGMRPFTTEADAAADADITEEPAADEHRRERSAAAAAEDADVTEEEEEEAALRTSAAFTRTDVGHTLFAAPYEVAPDVAADADVAEGMTDVDETQGTADFPITRTAAEAFAVGAQEPGRTEPPANHEPAAEETSVPAAATTSNEIERAPRDVNHEPTPERDEEAAEERADEMPPDLSEEEQAILTVDRLARAAAADGEQALGLSARTRAELAALAADLRALSLHREDEQTERPADQAPENQGSEGQDPETQEPKDQETESAPAAPDSQVQPEASRMQTLDATRAAGEEPANVGYPDNLSLVKGIGPVYRTRLYAAGISTWRQIAEADVDELRAIARPPVNADVDAWPERARALAEKHRRMDAVYQGPVPDDFTKIHGIGRHSMHLLYKAGICTYEQLARMPRERLAAVIPASPSGETIDYTHWIEEAKRHLARKRGDA